MKNQLGLTDNQIWWSFSFIEMAEDIENTVSEDSSSDEGKTCALFYAFLALFCKCVLSPPPPFVAFFSLNETCFW